MRHVVRRLRPAAWLAVLLALSPAVLAASPSATGPADAPRQGRGPWNLTIFHTNDMHGSFLPEPATWRDDRAPVGGMAALAWHLAEERRTAPASLLLDAGDFMTGNPICRIAVDGTEGAGLVDMMNAVGYDAGVPGNHEFDAGLDNARGLAARADFPLLAADILDAAGRHPFDPGPVVLERGGLRVGLIGVSCASLFDVTAHGLTAGLSLRDQATVAREQAAAIDPETDLLVLVTHDGLDGDQDLARRLAGSGIDVIVGGHSHTRLREPRLVSGILIVQAGSHLKNLGRLDLRVQDDRVVGYDGRLVELTADGAVAGEPLDGLVALWRDRVQQAYGEVIGELVVPWRREEAAESNVGDWLTDRIRERTGADVAFLNSGTIRKNVAAGPVTLLDLNELLPFANRLVVFDLTGRQLRDALLENARAAATRDHGIVQVSGARYAWREVGDHVELEDVTVGGLPLDPDATYLAAAPDYVAMKADRYLGLERVEFRDMAVGLTDAMVEAVRASGPIEARLDGRIRRLDRPAAAR